MLSVGQLIWVSCRPLIRLVLCVGCGFAITKADIFPAVAARGAGQIMLNIALPCLMASKVIPAFDSSNIKALGPLVLVALSYEIIGIAMAWIVQQIFWVPHRFRFGILVAGGWGNYGDIPTNVIMFITGAAPFNGTSDQTLSVAYISAFLLVFFITLFPLGAHRWIAMDYVGPEVEDDEIRKTQKLRWKAFFSGKWLRDVTNVVNLWGQRPKAILEVEREEMGNIESPTAKGTIQSTGNDNPAPPLRFSPRHKIDQGKCVSFHLDDTATETAISPTGSFEVGTFRATPSVVTVTPIEIVSSAKDEILPKSFVPKPRTSSVKRRLLRAVNMAFMFFRSSLESPASLSIIVSFIISLVPPLKALFVPGVPGTHIPSAPDGLPPLSFLIDTASFIGAASVPLGLICLGSALARLKLPSGQWNKLPLGAIGGLAVGKILIMPVLGVLICQGLANVGVIDKGDKVLRFVCIFFSCLPTATTQVFLTQVYSGTGTAEHLSAFLIPQYILMFISMTALTAYSLQLLF
ncbi:hypothetical protein PILCRDRAFT_793364 [Piloderma croceum F 1598]|uniref:Auxin efflux carrier n=1 Tax=Piloderma croceum (strain F 1598) TaxID=765440 RepID=A0A0C3BMX8_PILCF|nr:hypothetical protein PILCRDRAFT_793364 [Piloderma croceum F 1598]